MTNLKPRFDGHDELNDIIKQDWLDFVASHPDNYQALIYKPLVVDVVAEEDGYEKPLFSQLDQNQQVLEYGDPDIVFVIDNSAELARYFSEDGESIISERDQPMGLLINDDTVPVGTILEWEEVTGKDTRRRCWWYVQESQPFGTTKAGMIHYVIPCMDFDGAIKAAEAGVFGGNDDNS